MQQLSYFVKDDRVDLFHYYFIFYSDRQLTLNFELWVEIFCVPTFFHVRSPKSRLSVCPYPEKRNHLSFVNISPSVAIDTVRTSMEKSSWVVLQNGNSKILFSFQKKVEIVFWLFFEFWLVHFWPLNIIFFIQKFEYTSIKYQSYPKSRKIIVFGQEICFCRNPNVVMHPRPPGRHIGIDG